jgi:hypothetical protein
MEKLLKRAFNTHWTNFSKSRLWNSILGKKAFSYEHPIAGGISRITT